MTQPHGPPQRPRRAGNRAVWEPHLTPEEAQQLKQLEAEIEAEHRLIRRLVAESRARIHKLNVLKAPVVGRAVGRARYELLGRAEWKAKKEGSKCTQN